LGTEKLRALIVGAGNVAGGYDLRGAKPEVWTHAKAYQLTPGVELIGVVDSQPRVASAFARTWNVPFSGTDLERALQKTQPDIVSICSPTNTHVPLIKALCQAGVGAILCEKPIAYDLRAAEQALALCKKKGVLLAINYQRNWDRQSNRLREAIHSREYGGIELIRVLHSKGLLHNGSHFVSLLNHWFGDLEVDRLLSIHLCDRNDVRADFTATCPATRRIIFQNIPERTYNLNELEVLFEGGRLELKNGGLEVFWTNRHHDPLLPNDITLAEKSKRLPVSLPRAMLEVIRNFTNAIRGKEKLLSDPEAALRALRFCVAVRTLAQNSHA
jgi:predicted dehydrogenase